MVVGKSFPYAERQLVNSTPQTKWASSMPKRLVKIIMILSVLPRAEDRGQCTANPSKTSLMISLDANSFLQSQRKFTGLYVTSDPQMTYISVIITPYHPYSGFIN